MANTDRAGTMKRSRGDMNETESTTKSSKKRKKQKKQTKNNSKENKKAAGGDSSSKEQEITATPEGLAMTQVLSTLNKLEQSRFEAFRRSTLPGNAVSEYIAHLLLLQNEHMVARTKASSRLLGAGSGVGLPLLAQAVQKQQQTSHAKSSSKQGHQGYHHGAKNILPPLHDLVSPNNADSIVVVVSSLAKAYAQRLVTAAKRVAVAQGFGEGTPLQPHHLEQAHEARAQAGLDPGFFLQKPSRGGIACGALVSAALGRVDRHDLRRQAALEAQEEYDRYQASNLPVAVPKLEKEEEDKQVTELKVPLIKPTQVQKAIPMEAVKVEKATQPAEQKPVSTAVPVKVVKETMQTEKQKPISMAAPVGVVKNTTQLEEQRSLSTAAPAEVVKEITQLEEHKPLSTALPMEGLKETTQLEEQTSLPVDVMELDDLEDPSTDDEPSKLEPAAMAELSPLPQESAATTATPLPGEMEAAPLMLPPPSSAATAQPTSANMPMSMEDALLNDLDSDDSDDDD